ncbi:WbqC family protein [Phocaeicola sp.]|uniref:WbqC family protein n=1 Tax=Phocaeicola sp. TaxID=2773926 RepID=UPI0023D4D4B5|nr:WbqC family protein [Phocaeicola sp.]MDE5677502.1 WbqC family protein [Phocaeicola sp.]
MKTTIYLSSAYWAPVQYYTKLYACDDIYVEQCDHYVKQTYRNRCVIAAADGPLVLTVPTEKSETPKCLMKDVRISDHGNWRHIHWNALVAAYRNSPFFEYYADDFRVFYEKKYTFLWDYNQEICSLVCDLINIRPHIKRTKDYHAELAPHEADFREMIHPKRDWSETDPTFCPKPYYQVFDAKYGFLPNLSIADLLFNMGPESLIVLRDSVEGINPKK